MADSTLSPSGLPTVDAQWGGLGAGSATLLVGRAGAGRTALALQSAGATVAGGGQALLLSPRTPEALLEAGTAGGFDLRAAHATGRFRVLRIPAAQDLAARGSDGLDKAYLDLTGLVQKSRPDRVVVEDLTPLVQFDTFERFRAAFDRFAEAVRETGASLVVGLGEPANDASEQLLAVVRDAVDGVVTLAADGEPPHLSRTSDDAEAPQPEAPQPEAPQPEAPQPEAPQPEPVAAEPPQRRATDQMPDDLPQTRIVPPPEASAELLAPAGDAFGGDPAASMFDQGYLVDSGASGVVGVIPTPPAAPGQPTAMSPPAPTAPAPATPAPATPAPATPAPAALPAFAPLAGPAAPAPDPAAEVRQTLDAAFAARAQGAPFLVVAVRMDPAAPEAAHFFAVADGLRRALRAEDRLLVDLPRRRGVVVLPGVGAEGATALFARLQGHLRATLADEAEAVLAAVAAVSIPDGQPFASTADLLAYAYES